MTKSVAISTILLLVGAQPALAYIDPNTGGMLFQWLAIAFGSLSAFLLIFSRQIRAFFAKVRRRFGDQTEASSESAKLNPDAERMSIDTGVPGEAAALEARDVDPDHDRI